MKDTYTIERDGMAFRVEHEHDSDAGAPWENSDGHGPVSDWEERGKLPSELILSDPRGRYGLRRFYDFAEACKIALRDNWGSYSSDSNMTRRQFAAEQARLDWYNLRAWCRDEWQYIGVIVTLLDIEGNATDAVQSLWGIDDDGDRADVVASDLVGNCLHDISAMLYGGDGAVYMSGSRSWRVKA